jgi:spore germination protein GerM
VFFLRDGRLVAVTRRLASGNSLEGAIDALVAGPTDQDPPDLRTALPPSVTRLPATTTAGVATIEVPSSFDRIGARNEVLALGQLVFTAMAQPGVSGVRLSSGGVPIEVPVDGGQLVARPVTRSDYPSIAPL